MTHSVNEEPTGVDVGQAVDVGPETRLERLRGNSVLWIGAFDVALILLFGLISPGHVFFNSGNFTNMALDSAQTVLLAAGIALLLAAGELDISIGPNIILASVFGGKVMAAISGGPEAIVTGYYPDAALGIAAGVAVAIASGIGFGLVNAFIVTQMRVNSFIATLGTLGIGTGLSLVVSGGINVESIPPTLQSDFGIAKFAGIPLPTYVTVIAVAWLWFLLNKTRFGVRTRAIGSSRQSAGRAGIEIDGHLVALFALVGALAGISAVMDLGRFGTTNLSGHQTEALSAIAGAVIGGTNLFGGRASVVGAALGALLAVILQTGLVIQGLSPFYQLIVVGIVLIVAVWLRGGDPEGAQVKPHRGLPRAIARWVKH